MKAKTLVIVNPSSGGGNALRAEPRVASYLKLRELDADFVHSASVDDIQAKAAQAGDQGYTHVVALGGDGTFHHVIEGIYGTAAIGGFFPAGNGNDIARSMGIANDPVRAAEQFCNGSARAVDLIRVTTKGGRVSHYIGAGGLGLDAEAAYLANTRYAKLPGWMRYLAGTFSVFFNRGALQLGLDLDGEVRSGRGLFVAAANGSSYGAGARIAPDAKMDDGWMDVVVVGDVKFLRLLEALPRLFSSGDLRRFPEVERFRCKRAKILAAPSARVHGDGEDLGTSPAEFEVLPAAVRMVVP